MILSLALALAAPVAREAAMERCAEAVIASLHPTMGMADMTGTRFEWLSASRVGKGWEMTGSIIEPKGDGRIAHRFTCRVRSEGPPSVVLGNVIRM